MTLKIAKNIILSAEGRETLFFFTNPSSTGALTVVLFNAHSITGDLFAFGELKYASGTPQSSINFRAWGSSASDSAHFTERNWPRDEDGNVIYRDLSPFPPPYEELTNDWEDVPIPIPPETQFITLRIAQNDTVEIKANMKEEYVIIDDAGNELSLDQLLGRS